MQQKEIGISSMDLFLIQIEVCSMLQIRCVACFFSIQKQPRVRQALLEPRKGNCWDNAVAERFFKTIKNEWLNKFKFISFNQFLKQ